MIPPSRSRLAQLHSQEPAVFRRFLLGGLRGFFSDGKGRAAFGQAAYCIGNSPDITDDLRDIYACLEPDEQAAFQAGVVEALACVSKGSPKSGFVIASQLIMLAGKVGATDLLTCLPLVLPDLRQALPEADTARLIPLAYEAALAAAIPRPVTKDCFIRLLNFARPLPRMAYPILLAFTKADPAGLAEHLAMLWRELDAVFGYGDPDDPLPLEEEQRRAILREDLISRVFGLVTPADFLRSLDAVDRAHTIDPAMPEQWADAGDWWSQTLTSGSERMVSILESCSERRLSQFGLLSATPPTVLPAAFGWKPSASGPASRVAAKRRKAVADEAGTGGATIPAAVAYIAASRAGWLRKPVAPGARL